MRQVICGMDAVETWWGLLLGLRLGLVLEEEERRNLFATNNNNIKQEKHNIKVSS